MLIWVDTAQEMLDTTLLAYRIAEDRRVFLPIAISADGAFLTHSQTIVQVPTPGQGATSSFPRYNRGDLLLHPDNPITVAPQANEDWVIEIRRQNDEAMKRAYDGDRGGLRRLPQDLRPRAREPVVRGVHDGGRRRHPHGHGDHLAALQGRHPQHARAGQEGRPHPAALVPARSRTEQLVKAALQGAKAIGVIDRDYSFGSPFGSGVVANEIRAAMYNAEKRPPLLVFICGLGGREVTLEDVYKAADICYAAAATGKSDRQDATGWACASRGEGDTWPRDFANDTQILEPFKGVKKVTLEEYFTSGHRTCQGCESALVMKLMVKAAGPRTIVLGSTGCMYVANTTYYTTPWVVPWMHTQLGSSGSAALGTVGGAQGAHEEGQDEVASRSTSSPSAATAAGRTWGSAPSPPP